MIRDIIFLCRKQKLAMAKEENLQIQKSCILLSNDQVSVRQWRKYIADNWRKLTFCLRDGCIVILFGRHGEEGGQIGDEEHQNCV